MRRYTWTAMLMLSLSFSFVPVNPVLAWDPPQLGDGFFLPTAPVLPGPQPGNGILQVNQQLNEGQFMFSPTGNHCLVMQTNGDLVLYRVGAPGQMIQIWDTGTTQDAPVFAIMQGDGNFVLYNPAGPVGSTVTFGNPGAILAVQDDGNLVVYLGNRPLWSSRTNGQ